MKTKLEQYAEELNSLAHGMMMSQRELDSVSDKVEGLQRKIGEKDDQIAELNNHIDTITRKERWKRVTNDVPERIKLLVRDRVGRVVIATCESGEWFQGDTRLTLVPQEWMQIPAK